MTGGGETPGEGEIPRYEEGGGFTSSCLPGFNFPHVLVREYSLKTVILVMLPNEIWSQNRHSCEAAK